MSFVHQFGIIDEFEKNKDYSKLQPQEYNCISVSDDIVNCWIYDCPNMVCYRGNDTSKIVKGFEVSGVVVIPPESLIKLVQIVETKTPKQHIDEASELINKIDTAIRQDKYMIHYIV